MKPNQEDIQRIRFKHAVRRIQICCCSILAIFVLVVPTALFPAFSRFRPQKMCQKSQPQFLIVGTNAYVVPRSSMYLPTCRYEYEYECEYEMSYSSFSN